MSIPALIQRIEDIKSKLGELGEMRPGSLSQQFSTCGNASCRCKDPEHPQKHGPYYQLSYTRKGKSRTEFVSKDRLDEVRTQLDNYARFKELTEEWIDLSIELAQERRKEAKKQTK